MQNTAAICFAKTPGLTPAKTRLARHIGDERCLTLYNLMVARCRELMLQLTELETYVAVNEATAVTSPYWRDLSIYVQSEGTLGEKLTHAEDFFFQRHSSIIFWGTDSPALNVAHFSLVQRSLSTGRAMIVPALDGGFALYAANSKLVAGSWNNIHYSTSSTCHELQAQMESGFVLAPALSDLDTIDDIPAVLREMEEFPSQGPAWDELKAFLRTL